MTKPVLWQITLIILLAMGMAVNSWTQEIAAQPQPASPAKILVLTFSGGFNHPCLPVFEETVSAIGTRSGAYQATNLRQYELAKDKIDLSSLTPEYLNQFKAIVLYTTTGDATTEARLFSPEQKQALLKFVENGGGLVGVHTATDSFYQWPEYRELMGALFKGHPWSAGDPPVTLKVEDNTHPATKMLGPEWVIQDEIYQFDQAPDRTKFHRLLSIDKAKTDMNKKGLSLGPDGDYAVAWCRTYGQGRVFYTSLGHRNEVLADPLYQQHLLGGIKWVLGQEAWQAAAAVDTASPQEAGGQ